MQTPDLLISKHKTTFKSNCSVLKKSGLENIKCMGSKATMQWSPNIEVYISTHGLRTPGEEITFTAWPKIHSQIFRYGQSIYFVCHIGSNFQISLVYAFIGCPQSVIAHNYTTSHLCPCPAFHKKKYVVLFTDPVGCKNGKQFLDIFRFHLRFEFIIFIHQI